MNVIKQTLAVVAMNLRTIPQRLGNSLVIVIGMAGVVAVAASVFAMSIGMRATIKNDGRADRAVVLARGAANEYESSLSREDVAIIADMVSVKRDEKNDSMISGEVVLGAPVARKQDSADVSITLRGVGAQYFAIRPELKLIAGRLFRPGIQELVVGKSAQTQFAGVGIGDQVRLQDGDWTVVGVFAGSNGARDSELIADSQTVMSAYKLDVYNSVTTLLSSADSSRQFQDAITTQATLHADAHAEPEYLAMASHNVNRMLNAVAYVIGSIMSIGALFGALNSMQAVVVSRSVEIATLRAIGFGASAILTSILIEAVLLALAGAGVGIVVAYAACNGRTISTLGGAVWDSQLVYSLSITPSLAAIATVLACVVGLLGSIVPAIRAARTNIAIELQAN